MTIHDDAADAGSLDALLGIVGAEIARVDDALAFQDEHYLAWLARELRSGLTEEEHDKDERDADAFAARWVLRLGIARAERRFPRRELRSRTGSVQGTVAQALPLAAAEGCAVMLSMSAAAGAGRELWDETCDSWLELPPDIVTGRYLALGVSGDSMVPLLTPHDVILVKLEAVPVVDDLVVARVGENGFVVKRIASISAERMLLGSFNPSYPPLAVSRADVSLLGTVIARFSRGAALHENVHGQRSPSS
jgi:phage repressor protein C with HTH and peptisase S24 domain